MEIEITSGYILGDNGKVGRDKTVGALNHSVKI